MRILDPLGETLVELAARLETAHVPLIVGGGYGLVLRAAHLQLTKVQTLRPILPIRATHDLDLFLAGEVIAESSCMRALRQVLDEMGFRPIPGAEYYQFVRTAVVGGRGREIKVDLLAQIPEDRRAVSLDSRRIRPKGFRAIHAHTTPEAVTVGKDLRPLVLSTQEWEAQVYLPHPFSILLLKIFALRDQHMDPGKGLGRHHALDLYQTLRMTTEEEWRRARDLFAEFREDPAVEEAVRIRMTLLGAPSAMGTLRLLEAAREEGFDLSDYPVGDFLGHLATIFPA